MATKDKLMGWRIDDLAGLAITISFIISKKGQASRKDVEKLLGEKMANWKIGLNLERYVRYGYFGARRQWTAVSWIGGQGQK